MSLRTQYCVGQFNTISFFIDILSVFLLWGYSCHPSFYDTHLSEGSMSLHWVGPNHIQRERQQMIPWYSTTLFRANRKNLPRSVWLSLSIYVSLWLPDWSLCITIKMILCVNPWIFLLWATLCTYSCVYTRLCMCICTGMFVFVLCISAFLYLSVYTFMSVCVHLCCECVCVSAHLCCEYVCLFSVPVPVGILEYDCVSHGISGAIHACLQVSLSVSETIFETLCICLTFCVFNKGKDWEISTQSSSAPKLLCCYQTNP